MLRSGIPTNEEGVLCALIYGEKFRIASGEWLLSEFGNFKAFSFLFTFEPDMLSVPHRCYGNKS